MLSRYVQAASTPWRHVGDDVILAPPGRDDFDHLSGTAAAVWALLKAASTRADLVATLAEQYSVAAEDIAADVDALVANLAERGAIEEIP